MTAVEEGDGGANGLAARRGVVKEIQRQNFSPLRCWRGYLDEFEDGERGGALVGVDAAQYAVELRVEAAVAESEQEAAQQGDGHAEEEEAER